MPSEVKKITELVIGPVCHDRICLLEAAKPFSFSDQIFSRARIVQSKDVQEMIYVSFREDVYEPVLESKERGLYP